MLQVVLLKLYGKCTFCFFLPPPQFSLPTPPSALSSAVNSIVFHAVPVALVIIQYYVQLINYSVMDESNTIVHFIRLRNLGVWFHLGCISGSTRAFHMARLIKKALTQIIFITILFSDKEDPA